MQKEAVYLGKDSPTLLMRLTLIQTALVWENAADNRTLLTQKLHPLQGQTDVVVLPEMFTTGFSMRAGDLAESLKGPTMIWLREQAAFLQAAVTGSFICKENGLFYNRLVWMYPDGTYLTYDKKHLFMMAGEDIHYTPGQHRLIVPWKGWKICPLICYDLRFPEWSRNTEADSYDLLIYAANWPTRRAHHWQSLLTARAIENQCYTVGVNVFGKDGQGLEYQGDSCVVDYAGQTTVRISGQEGVFTATLNLEAQKYYRQQLRFLI